MKTQDDRTPEQKVTHRWGVVGRDSFMSGWGGAEGGYSRACWAVAGDGSELTEVEKWVRNRSDMKYVNVVDLRTYRPPRGTAHFHIYVVNPGHPALGRLNLMETAK